jgi:hypothetical protein
MALRLYRIRYSTEFIRGRRKTAFMRAKARTPATMETQGGKARRGERICARKRNAVSRAASGSAALHLEPREREAPARDERRTGSTRWTTRMEHGRRSIRSARAPPPRSTIFKP